VFYFVANLFLQGYFGAKIYEGNWATLGYFSRIVTWRMNSEKNMASWLLVVI